MIKVTVDEQSQARNQRQLDARELTELKNKIIKECMETIMLKINTLSER